ncbi:MAG: ribonuclease P protein component [Methylococcales bacterium]
MGDKSETFCKAQRLYTETQYRLVFSNPARFSTVYFTVLYRPNKTRFARLGLAISKKKIPKAVQRNRLKRRLRESFRLNQEHISSVDIVILVKKYLPNLSRAAHDEIQSLLWVPLFDH